MASSWFSTLECCFPQLSHAQRLAKLKAADDLIHDDDDSSTYSDCDDSDYSSSSLDESSDSDNEEAQQQRELLQTLAGRPGGMFVSDAVKNMLRNNIATGHHQHGPSTPHGVTKNAMMRRGSGNASNSFQDKVVACMQTHLPTQSHSDEFQQTQQQEAADADSPSQSTINPSKTLQRLLAARGVTVATRSSKDLQGFFFQHKQEHIDAYDMDVMTAVRSANLDVLRDLNRQGRQLQCCNKFHESIFHAAARRGGADVLLLLLHEANLDLRVCCASGRTPMHDACWTASPDFEVIRVILQECPDFLLIADNRNFAPLAYVPKDSWAAWNNFLETNQDLLIPKTLV